MMITTSGQSESLNRKQIQINPELLALDKKIEIEHQDIIVSTVKKVTVSAESLAD